MLQPGEILLDKYRIEALLGRGAFAEVYRVMHLALGVPRALKVLRRDAPGLGSTEFGDYQGRFQLEAQLGAQIDHPHVIRVHDFEQAGETLLLVMEYAAGGSLAERIAQARQGGGAIPTDDAVRIVREVAEGLAALHSLDIVHRDVKPSNILFDGQGRAKVADLGLAQVPHGPSQRSLAGSLAVAHPGTPAYMSPEQQGTTGYLGPASDVYGLGVVLFEVLTGRAYKNLRPGTRLGKLRADAPGWLDDLLARMLADAPRDRPWDGAEVAEALQAGQRAAREADAERQRKAGEAEAARQAELKRQQAQAARKAKEDHQRKAHEAEQARQTAEAAQRRHGASVPVAQRETEASPAVAVGAGSSRTSSVPPWQAIGIELVEIPAGAFLYGDTKQKVTLPTYYLGKTSVTNAQYKAFVDETGYRAPGHWQNEQVPRGKEHHPVVDVSWDDAQAFCAWAGLRLPTEREWEKGARGTDGRTYPWGDDWQLGRCNSAVAGVGDTTPVDRYPSGASPYGLLDMVGNVWEWCADWYDSSQKYRVLRGGSWLDSHRSARVAYRLENYPGNHNIGFGFRCARS